MRSFRVKRYGKASSRSLIFPAIPKRNGPMRGAIVTAKTIRTKSLLRCLKSPLSNRRKLPLKWRLWQRVGNEMKNDQNNGVTILPAQDALALLRHRKERVSTIMLDPWYNRGVGGVRGDYDAWLQVVGLAARHADHIFVWGFPELVCPLLNRLPKGFSLLAWLTWLYKTAPSAMITWLAFSAMHLPPLDRARGKNIPGTLSQRGAN